MTRVQESGEGSLEPCPNGGVGRRDFWIQVVKKGEGGFRSISSLKKRKEKKKQWRGKKNKNTFLAITTSTDLIQQKQDSLADDIKAQELVAIVSRSLVVVLAQSEIKIQDLRRAMI